MTVPVKPRRLKEGSVVAVISPSLAGPYIFPKVYQHGVSVLRDELGLEVVEMEHTRRPNYLMRLNPHLRGQDINDAFMDPGIDGLETLRRIREIRPDQKTIIVSGFAATERVRMAQELGAGEYVRKPYSLEQIGTAIRRALDRT